MSRGYYSGNAEGQSTFIATMRRGSLQDFYTGKAEEQSTFFATMRRGSLQDNYNNKAMKQSTSFATMRRASYQCKWAFSKKSKKMRIHFLWCEYLVIIVSFTNERYKMQILKNGVRG